MSSKVASPTRDSPQLAPRPARARSLPSFDPEPYRSDLLAILRAIEALPCEPGAVHDSDQLQPVLRLHPRDGKGFFSRSQLIEAHRRFAAEANLSLASDEFARRVQRRPIRSQSGVTPLTVLTKPFPCPGKCIFCPNDVRMPKSYLSDEPGAQRAAANRFDPYLQTWNRLAAYRAIGHPTDKVELIVLGGTWSFYPESYQRWFVKRLFDALNDFGAGIDGRDDAGTSALDFDALPGRIDGREYATNPYNRMLTRFLGGQAGQSGQADPLAHPSEEASWHELEAAHRRNEAAGSRSVGLVLETRPDHVTPEEVARLRRLGATKIQIGIQSLSDEVLDLNRRGHDVAASRRALRLLRGAAFKLHVHWMPNLHGATAESDIRDFARLFDDPAFRPDELKVYPCSLIESAELMRYYERGEWRPYRHEELLEVVTSALEHAPRYARLTRVIRDISSEDIVAGNKQTNFREIAERALRERGGTLCDIRAREIRGDRFDARDIVLRSTRYETSIGEEDFLEFVTPEDRIVAFARLSLPAKGGVEEMTAVLPELEGSALLRELHVYGAAVGIGRSASGGEAQHRRFGERLVIEAGSRAARRGFANLAVISAVGTRLYYRRLGFEERADGLYQHLRLPLRD